MYSVTIYPSEFGKSRLANEEKYGPEGHVVEETFVDDENDEENKQLEEDRRRGGTGAQ